MLGCHHHPSKESCSSKCAVETGSPLWQIAYNTVPKTRHPLCGTMAQQEPQCTKHTTHKHSPATNIKGTKDNENDMLKFMTVIVLIRTTMNLNTTHDGVIMLNGLITQGDMPKCPGSS